MFTYDKQVNSSNGNYYRNKYKTFIDNVMEGQNVVFIIAQHQNIQIVNIWIVINM